MKIDRSKVYREVIAFAATLPTLAEVRARRRAVPKPSRGSAKAEHHRKIRVRLSRDARESKKVKIRSGGRCEVIRALVMPKTFGRVVVRNRCSRPAVSIHHMISGRGSRAIGLSRLALHKQHVCDGPDGCHRLITEKRLVLQQTGALPRYDDVYVRRG